MAEPPKLDKKSRYTEPRGVAGAFEGETVTRRGLMTGTALAAGGVATMAFLLPGLGFALGPVLEDTTPTRWQDVGPEDDFNPATYVPRVINLVPEVGDAGKTTIYVRTFNPDRDKVIEGQDPQPYVAISTRCAHLGCPVRYIQASQKFVCPCHGGVYGFEGQVEGGPPVRPLDRFYTRVTAGRVEIGDRFSLNSELERFAPRDPSNHLDGLWQYLYPVEADHMKLPAPPKALRRTPRPGEKNGNGRNGAPPATKPTVKDTAVEGTATAVGWLDERTGLSAFLRGFLYRKVPKGTNWYYTLGTATMFAFLSQAVTGVFLAMYYEPDPTRAYESAARITNEVFLGEFVRGMHKWGSTVMICLIFLHMARTFFFGAYKYPRELNWVIGVVLLVLTLAMGLTGYLLPFDQRSFWATVVAVNINASGPIVGPYLADFLRAGAEFGPTTISRFYALHMLAIPGLIIALIGAHLYLVVKLGTTAPPWLKAEKKDLFREEV